MVGIHIYDKVCDPTEPNKEVVYNYSTGVGSEDEIAAGRVEMTSNPAYRTVTADEQSMYMIIIVEYRVHYR